MPLFRIVSGKSIVLPALPVWPAGAVNRQIAVRDELVMALRRHSPKCQVADANDASYVLVPIGVLKAALEWTLAGLAAAGIFYRRNAFDCEDFVNELDQTLRKMAALAGIEAAPLTCRLTVRQVQPWALVPGANGAFLSYHAVAGTLTNAGLWITESQSRTGESCPIETYPNRATIESADNL